MHSVANGRADTVGPAIQLGDFFPERRAVVINGETHQAWVTTNRRYPRPVQAQLDRYRNRYLSTAEPTLRPELNDPEAVAKLTPEERAELLSERVALVEAADDAYEVFLTDALMALIPTLDQQTVDMIPREAIESVLRDLGYFSDPTPVESTSESSSASGGTEEAAPLTGDISTPDSAVSTQPTG
jgi:hypothetical protein